MSGIAEVLLNLGYRVTGSDIKETGITRRLKDLGAKIFNGHREINVGEAHVVVISSAVKPDNPEVLIAKKNRIPVIPRIEMLAEIARLKYTIAVAGTHGKTTTTSMIASVLQEGGVDPTFIVGGKVRHLQSGANLGHGEFLVAEADESDGSFLKLSPTISIITNIDNDHLDFYKSVKNLHSAFIEFGNHVPFYGCVIVCNDDPGIKKIMPFLTRRVVTYGITENSNYCARQLSSGENGFSFLLTHDGKNVGKVHLKLSGKHNVLNTLAACSCAFELGIPFEKIAASLKKFESVERRLEIKGEKNGAIWVDDYGHHPTEIRATLSALKEKFPKRKLVVLFQPHRYSRTKLLLKDFGKAFSDADELFLLPIYPAGEKPIAGISSKNLLPLIKKNKTEVSLLNGAGVKFLENQLNAQTVFLTLGAGDVWKTGKTLFNLVK